MSVTNVAKIILQEMRMNETKFCFYWWRKRLIETALFVHLDISKLEMKGWAPKTSIEEGIRRTARYLLDNSPVLKTRK